MSKQNQQQRQIRSFVRRQSRMTHAQKKAFEQLWEKHGLNIPEKCYPLENIFNRRAPTCLEIGFGMGEGLIEMARANPDQNYIGVDVHKPGVGAVLMQIEKQHLHNIKVFHADVNDVLANAIPDESLDAIYIFFPDPWPKKRHHKRRLIQSVFIQVLRSKLKLAGILHIATDWEDYAHQMLQVMSDDFSFINLAGKGNFSVRPDYRPLTKFEKRGTQLGHHVWDLIFAREV